MVSKWQKDGNVAVSRGSLQIVLEKIDENCCAFVYNVIKCHLITKTEFVQKANKVFYD